MRYLLFYLAILIAFRGFRLAPQEIDPLALLANIEGPQMIIAETGAVHSQFESMDVFLHVEHFGSAGDGSIIIISVTQTDNHLAS